ncbi:MAG: hypothetical protein ACREV8_18080, partial [Gammaproteobacteria bacterium]
MDVRLEVWLTTPPRVFESRARLPGVRRARASLDLREAASRGRAGSRFRHFVLNIEVTRLPYTRVFGRNGRCSVEIQC